MPKWTPEQQLAIDHRGAHLLVSAAAGSGKTAVLVNRILKLILEDGIDVDRLLIITFTRAAAGEMRERIQEALLGELKENRRPQRVRRQLDRLGRAHIQTFHSFCLDVLRSHFQLVGLDPDFAVADIHEAALLEEEAMGETLEAYYEAGDPGFLDLVACYTDNRHDEDLVEMVRRLTFFLASEPDPAAWRQRILEQYENDHYTDALRRQILEQLGALEDRFEALVKLCTDPGGPQAYLETVESDRDQFERILEGFADDLETGLRHLGNWKAGRLKSIRKTDPVNQELKESAKSLRDGIKKAMDDMTKAFGGLTTDQLSADLLALRPRIEALFALEASYRETLRALKMEKGLLTFDDIEHGALEVLGNDGVAEAYRRRFDGIFVDEYQDSNALQEAIIRTFERETNKFYVGDVKQSIYRFRLADPTLFTATYAAYGTDPSGDRLRIDLSKNFRSRDQILHGINFLFHHLMAPDLGDVHYDVAARLIPGVPFEAIDEAAPVIHLVETGVDEEEELEESLEQMKGIEIEARLVAAEVKAALGTTTYDPKAGIKRELSYGDMVILSRSLGPMAPLYERVFEEAGIPLFTDSKTGYFDTLEVHTILSLFKLIDNPLQDLPLLVLLRSPIVGLDLEAMLSVRVASDPSMGYAEACRTYAGEASDETARTLSAFFSKLDRWRRFSHFETVEELLLRLFEETGYDRYVSAMPRGEQRRANLDLFLKRAADFATFSLSGLHAFIDYVERVKISGNDFGEASTVGEGEDVVRLMTIHKSKGLEFPLVFLVGLGKKFNKMDLRGDMVIHRDEGIGLNLIDPDKRTRRESFVKQVVKDAIDADQLSEELRILYVGLTRAVDRLHLFGSVKDLEKAAERWARPPQTPLLKQAGGYIDWIMTVVAGHPGGPYPLEGKDGLDDPFDSRFVVRTHRRSDLADLAEEEAQLREVDRDLLTTPREVPAALESVMGWSYPHERSHRPLKRSVSELKAAQADEHAVVDRPPIGPWVREKTGLDPAHVGRINHLFLEKIDFGRTLDTGYYDSLSSWLVDKHFLNEEEAGALLKVELLRFFDSPLARQIASADRLYQEVPFLMKEGETYVQGIIDLVYEKDGVHHLVDYKTDRVGPENLPRLVALYGEQLAYYRRALEVINGWTVASSTLYFLRPGRSVAL